MLGTGGFDGRELQSPLWGRSAVALVWMFLALCLPSSSAHALHPFSSALPRMGSASGPIFGVCFPISFVVDRERTAVSARRSPLRTLLVFTADCEVDNTGRRIPSSHRLRSSVVRRSSAPLGEKSVSGGRVCGERGKRGLLDSIGRRRAPMHAPLSRQACRHQLSLRMDALIGCSARPPAFKGQYSTFSLARPSGSS